MRDDIDGALTEADVTAGALGAAAARRRLIDGLVDRMVGDGRAAARRLCVLCVGGSRPWPGRS